MSELVFRVLRDLSDEEEEEEGAAILIISGCTCVDACLHAH